jgi:hypothetical protein
MNELSMLNVQKYYRALPHQDRALDKLQELISPDQLKTIAWKYRNNVLSNKPFTLKNAMAHFEGEPHQVAALRQLEDAAQPFAETFLFLWRQNPTVPPYFLFRYQDGTVLQTGLKKGELSLIQDGKAVLRWEAVSGQRYAQKIVHPSLDYSGSARPCPEGLYRLTGPWTGWYGSGIGAQCIQLEPVKRLNNRSQLLIHADANRSTNPGSLGCICPHTEDDMDRVADAMVKRRVQYLVVHYGFSSLESYVKAIET